MAKLKCVTCGTPLHKLEPTIYGCETPTCKLLPSGEVEPAWKATLPRAEFIHRGCYRIGQKDYRRAKRVTTGAEAVSPDVIALDADGFAYLYSPKVIA